MKIKIIEHTSSLLTYRVGRIMGRYGFFAFIAYYGLVISLLITFKITPNVPFLLVLSGGIFVSNVIPYLLSPTKTYIFDKTNDKLTSKKKFFFSKKITEYRLSEIEDVRLEVDEDSEGDHRYEVSLLLASGKYINLESNYGNFASDIEEMALTIRRFLNL